MSTEQATKEQCKKKRKTKLGGTEHSPLRALKQGQFQHQRPRTAGAPTLQLLDSVPTANLGRRGSWTAGRMKEHQLMVRYSVASAQFARRRDRPGHRRLQESYRLRQCNARKLVCTLKAAQQQKTDFLPKIHIIHRMKNQ